MENPWLAWYPGEYIGKTRRLSMAQHGAYMLLLWEYYINGPLQANASDLLNVCCAKSEADQVDMAYVLERFFVLRDGFYHNERADEELKKRESIREKRKLVGRKGGQANASRLLKQTPSKTVDSHNHNHSHIENKVKGGAPLANDKQLLGTPADLHPMQYAAHICDELAIPKNGNMQTVADSVEVLAKSRKTDAREAHDYLLAKALAAKEAGATVNVFWFRDGKYNITRQANDSHKTAAQLRNERASLALDRAFGAEEATGNMPEALRKGVGRV